MSPVLLLLALLAVGVAGSTVALTQDPQRQAVTLSVYGLLLGVVFVLFAAPDVALSQIAVGSVVVPLLVMLTVRTVRGRSDEAAGTGSGSGTGSGGGTGSGSGSGTGSGTGSGPGGAR